MFTSCLRKSIFFATRNNISSNCRWHGINYAVYRALINDFMKPRIDEASMHEPFLKSHALLFKSPEHFGHLVRFSFVLSNCAFCYYRLMSCLHMVCM